MKVKTALASHMHIWLMVNLNVPSNHRSCQGRRQYKRTRKMGIPKELPDCNARPILSLLVKTILIQMLQANSWIVYCCAMMDKYFFEVAAYAS